MTCPPINIRQLSFCTSNAFCNNRAVMVSATPCGTLLHSMVIHASASRFLAIRHEYAMEYAMMELQQWAESDRLGALRGL